MTPINITTAEHLGDYVLRLCFDDGTVQTVDFKPFLSLSRHTAIRAYLKPELFAGFRIEYGELVWKIINYVSLFANYILMNKNITTRLRRLGNI